MANNYNDDDWDNDYRYVHPYDNLTNIEAENKVKCLMKRLIECRTEHFQSKDYYFNDINDKYFEDICYILVKKFNISQNTANCLALLCKKISELDKYRLKVDYPNVNMAWDRCINIVSSKNIDDIFDCFRYNRTFLLYNFYDCFIHVSEMEPETLSANHIF